MMTMFFYIRYPILQSEQFALFSVVHSAAIVENAIKSEASSFEVLLWGSYAIDRSKEKKFSKWFPFWFLYVIVNIQ